MNHDSDAVREIAGEFESAGGLFDRSAEGKLRVFGPDAARFLHNLCTNDVVGLPVGAGCLAYFCDRLAKVQGQARIYRVGEDSFWLDVPAGTGSPMLAHLDKHLISERVEFADATGEYCQFHLAGPKVADLLARMTGVPIPPLAEYRVAPAIEHDGSIRRNDLLGYPGYDLVVPISARDELLNRLGMPVDRAGSAAAFEVLRIQARTPIYGRDIDEKRFVMEVADATKAVSYSKGCYLGQEPIVMARDRAGFVNRAMMLVRAVDPNTVIPVNSPLLRDGKSVGVTTGSSVISPKYGTGIALAYIQRGNQDVGTRLEAGAVAIEIV